LRCCYWLLETFSNTIHVINKNINILYVDDELNNLTSFKATFRFKYNVYTCISAEEAIHFLANNNINIIITDQRMPGMTGVEFLEKIIDIYPDPMRILLTGYTDIGAIIEAVNKGKIYHYLNKPWDEEELDSTIQEAYKLYLQKQELKTHTENLSVVNGQLEFLLRQKLLS